MTQICCPVCWLEVDLDVNLERTVIVALHLDSLKHRCDMSYKAAPARLLREIALEQTATRVLQLAADMREDIEEVWTAIDNAAPAELREWLLIALAAVNVERKPSSIFGWVHNLPSAVEAVAA